MAPNEAGRGWASGDMGQPSRAHGPLARWRWGRRLRAGVDLSLTAWVKQIPSGREDLKTWGQRTVTDFWMASAF